jgi:hypothetical protein
MNNTSVMLIRAVSLEDCSFRRWYLSSIVLMANAFYVSDRSRYKVMIFTTTKASVFDCRSLLFIANMPLKHLFPNFAFENRPFITPDGKL